jgi:hypothetical protein
MQKWEYLFLHYQWGNGSWEPKSISDPELEDWLVSSDIVDAANSLGDQGWEMVSYNPIVQSKFHKLKRDPLRYYNTLQEIRVVFKRPKE